MRLHELPEVDHGDYGWCVLEEPLADGRPRLVLYDDDDVFCEFAACDDQPCPGGDGHRSDIAAICYCPETRTRETVPHLNLRALPDEFPVYMPSVYMPSTIEIGRGVVYVVALVPELDFGRIKVGYTVKLSDRLKTFRTTNPTSILIGLWPSDPDGESIAHRAVGGRLGDSEVFQCRDLPSALRAIDVALTRER